MPEYLAPGVYVEEVDTGSKPIEGVSTSTAGMVGVAERGPVNIPILVTSYGEFTRWFGQKLRGIDSGIHRYLPHAVEGFFTNGGRRLYVVRVIDTQGAENAEAGLFDRGDADSAITRLLRAAPELSGTNVNAPELFVLDATDLDDDDWIRIGDGSTAEYRQVTIPGVAANNTYIPLSFPLHFSHPLTDADGNITVEEHAYTSMIGGGTFAAGFTLHEDADPGDRTVVLSGAAADISALAAGHWLEIGDANEGEHHIIDTDGVVPVAGSTTEARVRLSGRIFGHHDSTTTVTPIEEAAAPTTTADLNIAADANNPLIFVDGTGNFSTRGNIIVIKAGDGTVSEINRIGDLSELTLSTGAYESYAQSSLVEPVTLAGDGTAAKQLSAEARAGSRSLSVDNRVGLAAGDVIRIGAAPDDEYISIDELPNRSPGGIPPDAGTIILEHPLRRTHVNNTAVQRQDAPVVAALQPTALAIEAPYGNTELLVTDGDSYAIDSFIRVTTPSDEMFFHRLAAAADTGLTPAEVEIDEVINRAHATGSVVVSRDQLFEVEALDPGAWGNRLRISVEDEPTGLVSRTTLAQRLSNTSIRLGSATGVEAGTVLELLDPTHNYSVEGDPLKVESIDRRNNNLITLAATTPLSLEQITRAVAVEGAGGNLAVRSREFRLTVRLLRQPDPGLPARNDTVIDTEVFRHLSMDPRHTRYAQTIIGDINGDLRQSDRRPEGESRYIRIDDLAANTAVLESVRLGPETLRDMLPNGTTRPARHNLVDGFDSINTLTHNEYIGQDNPEPELRTGLQSLRNHENVSIVAIPGQTNPVIQEGLITHCEQMRYRFAVLDGPPPNNDEISDVQTQRQQFDTKYAALYHPWLMISDPFPVNLGEIQPYPIAPSGHMVGIYARTDITRGVHKAPANEVVRGITGLRRKLNKGEHDILNPVNINVIRDFRRNNRGIRVWGGRVITSDPDWKYVNVRRLLIFLERSIELGLQWVVFEPNAEPLWARVRRSVTNFLTVVWRNGALEGTSPELGFYVKCDRTTMTQTDIDNGRLICEIGVAPVKPAEFVIVRIGLWTANAEDA